MRKLNVSKWLLIAIMLNLTGSIAAANNPQLTSVASSACRTHATLTKVSFPATMRTIGTDAFAECYALSDVTFKEGIETLSARCFTNCRNIVSLALPSTITSLGVATFAN